MTLKAAGGRVIRSAAGLESAAPSGAGVVASSCLIGGAELAAAYTIRRGPRANALERALGRGKQAVKAADPALFGAPRFRHRGALEFVRRL
jgi:hypothetical protein